jgi:glycosyltransferase involved in cell wall biosynthesis
MGAGCPVICSNTSSLPEVAGNAAFLFDPYSVDSIQNALLRSLKDDKLRDDLIARGRIRTEQFSYMNTAQQFVKMFLSV